MNVVKPGLFSKRRRLEYVSQKMTRSRLPVASAVTNFSALFQRDFAKATKSITDDTTSISKPSVSTTDQEPTISISSAYDTEGSENEKDEDSQGSDSGSSSSSSSSKECALEELHLPSKSFCDIQSTSFSRMSSEEIDKEESSGEGHVSEIIQGPEPKKFKACTPRGTSSIGSRREYHGYFSRSQSKTHGRLNVDRTLTNRGRRGWQTGTLSACTDARRGRFAKIRHTPLNTSARSLRTSGSAKSLRTSGSAKSTSGPDSGYYILAVTEGRGHARGEVGIAAMDPLRSHLILCQISDNQRYLHSLTKINVFEFSEIIVPNTFVDGASKLYTDIRDNFPRAVMTSVQRRHFNETVGLELINQYRSPESETVMVLLRDKFYALSAASALVKYVEYSRNVVFAPRTVRVEYQGTEETMLIDINTANRLELVASASNVKFNVKDTLFGVLNHCHTRGGVRLLRATILQPPCSLTKIQTRLDCVEELVHKPLLLFALESAVTSFANVELLSPCVNAPQQDDLRAAEHQLKYVLLLKTMLELVPSLVTALEEATSPYFCTVRENLQDARFKIILDRILESIFENAKSAKGSVAAHLHCCFATRPGINDLLDVAKKTYCEIIQEIWELVDALREKHNLPLRMSFSSQKGFHIQYTQQAGISSTPLPKEFILVQKRRSTYSFYTAELVALDHRSEQVLHEIKLMTNVILVDLLNDVRQHFGCLFNLCEYVAELDMIVSFAHVSSSQGHVRPQFGDKLDVEESRHPILDVIHDVCTVPNDIYADKTRNCTILTGPNQSGKSIFIGQVALLQIMAQLGCYVPAKKATFRITDHLFSRIGFNDSIECNASTLMVEMQDVNYFRQNLTPNSLVIIDELCRGTSVEEGTSLAFTVCEELLDSSAFVFVTTHYLFLTKLEDLYSNVVNYHFESELISTEDGRPSLRFTHKKLRGVTNADNYGLKIAAMMAFPSDVLKTAQEIAEKLVKERKPLPEVRGLSAKHRLAQDFQKELSTLGADSDRGATILRYRDLLSQLEAAESENGNAREEGSKDEAEDDDALNTSLDKLRLTAAAKPNRVAVDAARKIARKYRLMAMRRRRSTTSSGRRKFGKKPRLAVSAVERNFFVEFFQSAIASNNGRSSVSESIF